MAKDYKEQLKDWLAGMARWGRNKWLWQEEGEGDPVNGSQERVRVHLYTDGHSYSITATPDYLGCIASARKPRPGEDWSRGNDLADGRFSEDTWVKILKDIVGYELKSISGHILNPPQNEVIGAYAVEVEEAKG